ncbi:MAG: methyltransferase domain-containing protein [Planctomycetes bacterium]|nr:methyltransferase domain-containing protein [Planctomycetota bacterium]
MVRTCIGKALPHATIIGIDVHPQAIVLGNKNKEANNIENVTFIQSDLYQALSTYQGAYDLIISNPPYIAESEYTQLSDQVRNWEDKNALVADEKGFSIHKRIINGAAEYLKKDSVLIKHGIAQILLECGKGQADELQHLFEQAKFGTVTKHKDLEGVDRWITAKF